MACANNCAECSAIMKVFNMRKRKSHTGMYLHGKHPEGVRDSIRQIADFDYNLTPHFRSLVDRGLLRRLTTSPAWYELV